MEEQGKRRCTAFEGVRCIASGGLAEVAMATRAVLDRGEQAPILIFDDATGQQVEVDFRGTPEEVRERIVEQERAEGGVAAPPVPRGPGRPKLGVVAREVTLLPRHWDWLNGQPGGASVALRKLVEEARRTNAGRDRLRTAQEATYRVLSALAGNLPGFEEATRALFAGDPGRFAAQTREWPEDIRDYVSRLAREALPLDHAEASRRTGRAVV
jgi:hypothetical protein